jgi:hypothetical protein
MSAMATGTDSEELAHLRRLWEMHYEISTDGIDWVAKRRAEPGTVLTRPTSESLGWAIRGDCLKADDGGYWIERQSGPPYYVAPLPATTRVPNSTA